MTKTKDKSPDKRLHLDRRTEQIIANTSEGDDDQLLTTVQIAGWLGVSPQWCELARAKGYGPPFTRLAPNAVRYKRADVIKWLRDREFLRTSDYVDNRRRKKATRAEAE